jgi:hypothetical protein
MALKTPALNELSPQRGVEESDASPRCMTAAGTHVITGLLLVMVAAVAFGWPEVEIVTVGGGEEAVTSAWMWLAFLLTLIVPILGALAYRAAPTTTSCALSRPISVSSRRQRRRAR